MRRLVALVTLVLAFATPALATEQIRERIVIDGRYQQMDHVPLLQWNPGRPFPWPQQRMATNCWRGYVGSWLLEGDQLFLLSIRRMASVEGGWANVPLAQHFGSALPVPADWYTGTLTVPLGNIVARRGWARNTMRPSTLEVEIVNGRVTERRVRDNRTDRALVRSYHDLEWVAKAHTVPPDDGRWHDARLLDTDTFRQRVPAGTPFRTRGLLMTIVGDSMSLFIPESPLAPGAGMDLENVPEIEIEPYTSPPVEIRATWRKGAERLVLDVSSVRKLEPGETIHHRTFPIPVDAQARARKKLEEDAWQVDSVGGRQVFTGDFVKIEGVLEAGVHPTVFGVEVAGDKALTGKLVVAFGHLEQWWVTPHLIETDATVAAWVGTRGPGEYYRLTDPFTGGLVRPRAAP